MRRFLLVAVIGLSAAACASSGHKPAAPTATTTTVLATTTTTTVPVAPPTTVATTTTVGPTSTTVATSSVRIVRFTGPAQPQSCNAPTMVQLSWTTAGAAHVEMHVDGGGVFATYTDGTHAPLLYLPCDGKAHTYELVAINGSTRVTRTVTVRTQPA